MKTYKTIRGLNNALGKALGEPSKATSEGTMTDGWMCIPIKSNKLYRVLIIKDGYPFGMNSEQLDILEDTFGGKRYVANMFNKECLTVDILLEVSK